MQTLIYRLYVVVCFVVIPVAMHTGIANAEILSGMQYDQTLAVPAGESAPLMALDPDDERGMDPPMDDRGPLFVECDDFNRPDSTTVDGWTEQTGDWAIASNRLETASGNHTEITYDGSTLSGDFCVTVQVFYAGSGVQYCAAMGWFQDPSTHMMFKVQDNGNVGYYDSIGLYQNNLGLFEAGLNLGTNPVIQLEVAGSTAYGRVDVEPDGVWDFEFDDVVSPSSGLCGVRHFGNTSTADDWCYGDECGAVPPTPTPTITPIPSATPVPTLTPTPTEEPCINNGDVTLDGELTAGDAQLAFLIALGSYSPTFEEACAADCNGDEEVTAGDAQQIFLTVLGSQSCVDPL